MSASEQFRARVLEKLTSLYGEDAPACLERVVALGEQRRLPVRPADAELWNERDIVLITYGDQVASPDATPLETLRQFLLDHRLDECLSTVHLLPFFPYSSDDGFSVIDYERVDPRLGGWSDIAALNRSFSLMFDLVLNHCSQSHRWFQEYLQGNARCRDYFLEVDPAIDLTAVTRPRSTPLLTPFETDRGTRHVWTTFSADQVDLNYANPDVLCEMIDVLLQYVQKGARIIRLDAIAYLWKTVGTSCIHLPETHCVVKLLRDMLDEFAPGTILLTETNVPHEENVSYFGDGDEAQMVYQFSLAPLLLDAFLAEDAAPLMAWLSRLEPAAPGTTFFNFTASHDGIGVRPLEGLVSQQRLDRLVSAIRDRGGLVSTRRNPDGTDSPYELNITWFSALGRPEESDAELQVRRFLSSQAVMLALAGIPGIYFHSLVGTPNDRAGVDHSGRARSINRRKYQHDELERLLADPRSSQRRIFDGYRRMLAARINQPAFHPAAEQSLVDLKNEALISFLRVSLDGGQAVLALTNVSGEPCSVDLSVLTGLRFERDLLGTLSDISDRVVLPAYSSSWLASSTPPPVTGPPPAHRL